MTENLPQYAGGEEVRVKPTLTEGLPYCVSEDAIGVRRPAALGVISHMAEPVDDLLLGQQLFVVMYPDGNWGMFGGWELQSRDVPLDISGIWPDA